MQLPDDEYLIYLSESASGKTKEGGFTGVSQDIIISSILKYANYNEAIGRISIKDNVANILFKRKESFKLLEKIYKIFDLYEFKISICENLETPETALTSNKQNSTPQTSQNPQINRERLENIFTCPHLTAINDINNTESVKGFTRDDAYNCLFKDKDCPLKLPCMEPKLKASIAPVLDFNKFDLYIFEFENHGKKYNWAISNTNSAIIEA